jgi:DNA-binding SARP family transcriptional activator
MHDTLKGIHIETNMLASSNTNKIANSIAQEEAERYFDGLAKTIHLATEVPSFIVAPRRSGRTSLAYRYVQKYRQDENVHWLDGSTEVFVQGVETGSLLGFLTKNAVPNVSEQMLIIDDLTYLEPWQAQRLSDSLDTLVEQGWRVLVITTPQCDCYDNLQSDRCLIASSNLLNKLHCTPEQQLDCILHFLRDNLPLELRLFAALTAILQELDTKEACSLGFSVHDDVAQMVATLNPLFELDNEQPTQLTLKGVPLENLLPSIQEVFSEYYGDVPCEKRAERSIETLTRLSMELLKKGKHARSHETLSCVELLVANQAQASGGQINEAHTNEKTSAAQAVEKIPGTHALDAKVLTPNAKALAPSAKESNAYEPETKPSRVKIPNAKTRRAKIRAEQEPLYVRLFGELEIYRGNTRVEHRYLRGKRVQSLLALILLSPRKCVTRDTVIQQFWPQFEGERAVNNFHVTASRLTRTLAPSPDAKERYFFRNGSHYYFDSELVASDVDQFEEQARKVIRSELSCEQRLEAVFQMESLYRDDLLVGVRLDGALLQYRKRQHNLLVDALLTAADLTSSRGDVQSSLWFTRRAYDYDHAREDVYRALMDAQSSAGQRTSAIETYFACKEFLHEELGILPSLRTTALYQDLILNRG